MSSDSSKSFSFLRELKLDHNLICTLPSSLGGLHLLETLDAGSNRLESIGAWIGDLKSLTMLNLVGNTLEYLPKEASTFTRFVELWYTTKLFLLFGLV